MKTTLVIMAAGIGSRFGGGIKQLETVGPNGEIIMDYSIHDAVAAGFNKIVFIIRRDIEDAFREVIGERIEAVCRACGVEVAYAYQQIDALPDGFGVPEGRRKPWGTCHAVLACENVVDEPFAVINADDYYGKEAYQVMHSFLTAPHAANEFAMVGFPLENTLSPNGGVTRGVCGVDENGYLTGMEETHGIKWTDGKVTSSGGKVLEPKSRISMNMWGLSPAVFGLLRREFASFLAQPCDDILTRELVLPAFMGGLLNGGEIRVKMLPADGRWLGMTYKEDVEQVRGELIKFTEAGEYSADLFSDL